MEDFGECCVRRKKKKKRMMDEKRRESRSNLSFVSHQKFPYNLGKVMGTNAIDDRLSYTPKIYCPAFFFLNIWWRDGVIGRLWTIGRHRSSTSLRAPISIDNKQTLSFGIFFFFFSSRWKAYFRLWYGKTDVSHVNWKNRIFALFLLVRVHVAIAESQ